MSEGLLFVFKFPFLALLYGFLWRAWRLSMDRPDRARRAPAAARGEDMAGSGPQLSSCWIERVEPSGHGGHPPWPLVSELLIGRSGRCEVVVRDPFVSTRHARIRLTPGGPVLEDLGSRNGTFLGPERLSEPALLQDGDTFSVGEETFRVRWPGG